MIAASSLRFLHRWIGLTVGVVFAIVSISGASLLFQPQFFRWAHGEMIPHGLPQQIGSIEAWVTNARSALPDLHEPIIVWLPQTDHNVSDAGMVVLSGAEPGGLGNLGLGAVLVAPSTGQVLGVVDIDRSPAYAPIFLHGSLWTGDTGKLMLGIVSVGTLVLLSIGLYLWWPLGKHFLRKLSPRPWRDTFAYASRLHDWVGIWALLLLFILTITGLHMVQPNWVAPMLTFLPEAGSHHDHAVRPPACGGPITLDAAIDRARTLMPSATLASAFTEGSGTGKQLSAWEFVFRPPGSKDSVGETHVLADLDCGTVVIEETPAIRSPRDVTSAWLSSLHDGTVFGMTGRIVVTLVGIAPLVLAWSGIRIWMRRRGWLRPRKRRAAAITTQ